MKKLQVVAAFAMLTLVACQKEQTGLPTPEGSSSRTADVPVLVKTAKTYTKFTYNPKDVFTVNLDLEFSYNGTKLNTIVTKNAANPYFLGSSRFTYDGDLIVKKEDLNLNGNVTETKTYSYDRQGRIIQFKRNGRTVLSFQYKANGIVEANNGSRIITYTFSGNTVTKFAYQPNLFTTVTYDGKNSPFKNITGFQQIIFFDTDLENHLTLQGSQNPLKNLRSNSGVGNINDFAYTYNDQNYPTSATYTKLESIAGVGAFSFDVKKEYTY